MKLDIATQKNGITTRQQKKLNKIMESDYEVRTIVNTLFKNHKIGMLHDSEFNDRLMSYALNKQFGHITKNELINEIESDNEYQDNIQCDFCGEEIENRTSFFDGDSAFLDGSAFTNLGYDDRVACADCAGNIKFEGETE
tara:strand:- start:30 stop:449 length:420 start_codon:yes stop_codon:yes gene_type:complete